MSGQIKPWTPAQAMRYAKALRQQTIAERITTLASVYGSVRALGRALNIDHAYLHRLKRGDKTGPSKGVLRKLGLDDLVDSAAEGDGDA